MQDLLRALGIARVARVTGLDRAGVEVACAIRPGGHVLQVANGKGLTWDRARASAISEAAELWAAERVDLGRLVFGSRDELPAAWDAGPVAAARFGGSGVRRAWVRARDLLGGGEVLVPAHAVHCPPPGTAPLGPASVRWTSNGMGAHPSLSAALLHALLEAVERDQLAEALPGGWTPREIRERRIAPPASLAAICERQRAVGLEPYLFDLSGDLRLPVAGAILVDHERGPLPATAGYACALEPADALLGALLEAAQSRLTDVHGAREDVLPADHEEGRALAAACARSRPVREVRRMPHVRHGGPGAVLAKLAAAGHRRVATVELSPRGFPLRVVKVIAPDLRLSELV